MIFYDMPPDAMLERCKKRAETSKRFDDTEEILKRRIQNYEDQSKPVIEYYQNIGKVRRINVLGDISDTFRLTKEAVLPQTICVIGPKQSGKTKICEDLARRTYMKHIDFVQYVKDNGLKGQDDESKTLHLI